MGIACSRNGDSDPNTSYTQVKGQLVTLAAIDATDDHPNEHIPWAKETDYSVDNMVRTIPVHRGRGEQGKTKEDGQS